MGEVDPRPGIRVLRTAGRTRRRAVAPSVLFGVHAEAADRWQRAARSRADGGRTPRGRVAVGLGGRRAAASRRRCTRSTPTPDASPSPRRAYNTAIVAGEPARVPVRRHRARAAVRRRAGGRREHRRTAARRVRRARARRLRGVACSRHRHATTTPAAPHARLRLTRAPAGVGVAGGARCDESPTPGSFDDLRATGTTTTATLRARHHATDSPRS